MQKNTCFIRKIKGFTLIEMAIVVVIIGLLIAIGVKLITPLIERIKEKEANEAVDAAVASIIGYAEENGKLPAVADFDSVVRGSTDVWGNDIVYRPAIQLLDDDSICARSTTNLSLCKEDSGCTTDEDIDNVAFFILSRGKNQNIQTDVKQGSTDPETIQVYSTGLAGVDNYDGTGFWSDPVGTRTEQYRDITKWVVLPELRVKAGCSGSPLEILTVELPSGYILSTYSANVYAEGGVQWDDGGDPDTEDDYEWCVESALPNGLDYKCNGTLSFFDPTTDPCSLSSGKWQQCTSLEITGAPTVTGTFSLPVYVRDNADNIANRTFGLTISQILGLHICEEYRVWSTETSTKDFWIDEACYEIPAGNEITDVDVPRVLQNGEEMVSHNTTGGACGATGSEITLKYNEAIFADNNADCCIEFDGEDKICP